MRYICRYWHISILLALSLIWTVSCSSNPSLSPADTSTRQVNVDLVGSSHTISIDGQGRLTGNTQITSSDGKVSLTINKDAMLLDEDRQPLRFIKVAVDPTIPVPPKDAEIVGEIFDIKPQGAMANPSLRLTLKYDTSLFPNGTNENDAWIFGYIGEAWELLPYKQIDIGAHRVTTTITRFGKYSVLAPTKPIKTSTSVSQSSLTSITLTQALTNGKPTLAEFGRGTCIPCKEMKPILENLAIEYQNRLNVPIVSVDEYRDLTNYYKVMAIPTQIGFDSSGKEVFRHVGFWSKDQILTQLTKLSIK